MFKSTLSLASPVDLIPLHNLPLARDPPPPPALAEVVADDGVHLVAGPGVVCARAPHVLGVGRGLDCRRWFLDLLAAVAILPLPEATPGTNA